MNKKNNLKKIQSSFELYYIAITTIMMFVLSIA